ncbi:MAG TPA: protein-disulfide reductase DsbD domain-containing protein [Bryobacteraceae bacterium]|nr:protein-disulfide reductase DsbD domain-containing protein [Bryobacteraceae bacterium]
MQSPPPMAMKTGVETPVKLHVKLNSGYHVNSDKPADEYLIPLKLTWTAEPLTISSITFPEPKMEKYSFSEKPLSVYTGDFDIVTKFRAPANTPKGEKTITGKMRYQACSTTACYPPRSADVKIIVNIY